jgi:excisionase family DNA binding protein
VNLETVSPRRAAQLTKIGEHHIREAVACGALASLPVGKTGKHRRIRLVDLEAWLESLTKSAGLRVAE